MEEKMLEFLQEQINEVKWWRENNNKDMANSYYWERFNPMRDLYEYATGKKIIIKHWIVSSEEA